MREHHRCGVVGKLEERASIEVEGFDDAALGILDRAVDQIRVEVDELGREVRDDGLEAQAFFEHRPKRIESLGHGRLAAKRSYVGIFSSLWMLPHTSF